MTYLYTHVSEELANFNFAVTELRPRRRLNSATLNIAAATPPKRQDQPQSYTESKPTRVSSNYYSIATYFVRQTYTGCNRRNGPDFGRVFLMLNYTVKPQNTYIQSSMVTEI